VSPSKQPGQPGQQGRGQQPPPRKGPQKSPPNGQKGPPKDQKNTAQQRAPYQSNSARERAREQAALEQRRRRDRRILAIVAAAVVVLVVAGGIGFQVWRTSRAPTAGPSTNSSFAPVTIADSKPIVLGSTAAPVHIRLYEDFHCPHCAEFEEEFGSTITAAQEKGQIVVDLYPMAFIDEGSAAAANAMACAAESGFGQAYYLGLFANHTLQWSDAQLESLASKTSSSVPPAFSTCVRNDAHQSWVNSINTAADSAGVTGTPTMYLNDKLVDIPSLTTAKLTSLINAG
jgi:protein-disulfide isomerase